MGGREGGPEGRPPLGDRKQAVKEVGKHRRVLGSDEEVVPGRDGPGTVYWTSWCFDPTPALSSLIWRQWTSHRGGKLPDQTSGHNGENEAGRSGRGRQN